MAESSGDLAKLIGAIEATFPEWRWFVRNNPSDDNLPQLHNRQYLANLISPDKRWTEPRYAATACEALQLCFDAAVAANFGVKS